MGLAFVPLYIQYLGIEAYGLIGLFAVLQAWLSLLDMGLTPRRCQVRALASRSQGAAGRRSRGSALHRMLAVREPTMIDPTRREAHDAPGKTRLERDVQAFLAWFFLGVAALTPAREGLDCENDPELRSGHWAVGLTPVCAGSLTFNLYL